MSTEITPEQRRQIAGDAGLNEQYVYQCLTGRKEMHPAAAASLERKTRGLVRRWHLCQKTWHEVWPELVKAKGAPPVPAKAEQG